MVRGSASLAGNGRQCDKPVCTDFCSKWYERSRLSGRRQDGGNLAQKPKSEEPSEETAKA